MREYFAGNRALLLIVAKVALDLVQVRIFPPSEVHAEQFENIILPEMLLPLSFS